MDGWPARNNDTHQNNAAEHAGTALHGCIIMNIHLLCPKLTVPKGLRNTTESLKLLVHPYARTIFCQDVALTASAMLARLKLSMNPEFKQNSFDKIDKISLLCPTEPRELQLCAPSICRPKETTCLSPSLSVLLQISEQRVAVNSQLWQSYFLVNVFLQDFSRNIPQSLEGPRGSSIYFIGAINATARIKTPNYFLPNQSQMA